MLTLDQLSRNISACEDGQISIDDFEDWFRSNSRGAYAVPAISSVVGAIEGAFSKYDFQGIDEPTLKLELANAIRPFLPRADVLTSIAVGVIEYLFENGSTSRLVPFPPTKHADIPWPLKGGTNVPDQPLRFAVQPL